MGKVRVAAFGVSIDGFGAGPNMLRPRMKAPKPSAAALAKRSSVPPSCPIIERKARVGKNQLINSWPRLPSGCSRLWSGPAGDDWGGPDWKGWWGDDPPYHAPTFILTHHARAPIVMEGGTTFHFVTDGIEAALAQAKAAAGDLDVKIGGGVSTVRQYLLAGAIDEMHLALSPVVLGRGESLFADIDLPSLGYRVTEVVPTELATHLVLTR